MLHILEITSALIEAYMEAYNFPVGNYGRPTDHNNQPTNHNRASVRVEYDMGIKGYIHFKFNNAVLW